MTSETGHQSPVARVTLASAMLALGLVLGWASRPWLFGGREEGGAGLVGASSEPVPAPSGLDVEVDGDPGSDREPRGREGELHELRRRLQEEVDRRSAAEQALARLQAERDESVAAEAGSPASGERGAPADPGARAEGGAIDGRVLLAAGFDEGEVETLRERLESIELERLFIRNQATREGWLGRPRFRNEMARLEAGYGELRAEYGDDAYDWILFASGRPNRVGVQHVMGGSPAEEAGIEPGDWIVAYDERRVFDARELQQATTRGQAGELVAVDVDRDGEPLRFYLPAGPIGIHLQTSRREPVQPR